MTFKGYTKVRETKKTLEGEGEVLEGRESGGSSTPNWLMPYRKHINYVGEAT